MGKAYWVVLPNVRNHPKTVGAWKEASVNARDGRRDRARSVEGLDGSMQYRHRWWTSYLRMLRIANRF
jgi:hypothetical protein